VCAPVNLFLECDKSFTRSDALAKHMRLQHNLTPPAPGRGGARKRKRGVEEGNNMFSVALIIPQIPFYSNVYRV
jgi:hypothetical protein